MAKRFTDTDKWRKPWFRTLNYKAKMVWGYLTDNCDHAGIWPAAFDLLSGDIGFKVTPHDLEEWFGEKVIPFGDKYFIPSFIEFQYGELSDESRPHQSVIKVLLKYGIDPKKLTLSEGYPKGIRTLKDKDKEKEQDKEKGECEGEKQKPVSPAQLEEFYQAYPRKLGKSQGLRVAKSVFKTQEDLEYGYGALNNYVAHLKREGTEAQFILHFSTWMNQWRDWLDPNQGTSDGFVKREKTLEEMDFSHLEFDSPEAS